MDQHLSCIIKISALTIIIIIIIMAKTLPKKKTVSFATWCFTAHR